MLQDKEVTEFWVVNHHLFYFNICYYTYNLFGLHWNTNLLSVLIPSPGIIRINLYKKSMILSAKTFPKHGDFDHQTPAISNY